MSSMAALLVISLCVLISGCLAAPNQDLDVGQARANGDISKFLFYINFSLF